MARIEEGNARDLSPQGGGWLVGFGANFRDPTLRWMAKNALAHTIGVKWMAHEPEDPAGTDKPRSDGCTLSILVSPQGDFQVEFTQTPDFASLLRTARLREFGDFVVWGGGLERRWSVVAPSTILTVRWVPIES